MMINNPETEPYFKYLTTLGYQPFNYSEKHYLFTKERRIIKIARSIYNNPNTDESYYIEAQAHKILQLNGFDVAKINHIYKKGELVNDFIVLEEEKINGQVYYQKDSDINVLKQIIEYMQNATEIEGERFGMVDKCGGAIYSSWLDFLTMVISRIESDDKERLLRELIYVPQDVKSSFVFTDCNTANFVFESDKLKCAIDIERPMWGDRDFLFGVIKARNPYMFDLAVKLGYVKNMQLINLYSEIYNYIFD